MKGKRWNLELRETRHHIMSTARFLMKMDMTMAEREVEMFIWEKVNYVMLDRNLYSRHSYTEVKSVPYIL